MKKRPHAETIKAWADGHTIEISQGDGVWETANYPLWYPDKEYRVKREPDFEMYGCVGKQDDHPSNKRITLTYTRLGFDNLKLTFDGGTKQLKSAEVL